MRITADEDARFYRDSIWPSCQLNHFAVVRAGEEALNTPLKEAAARKFEEGLEDNPTEAQSTEVHNKNVGNFALRGCFGV